MLTDHLTPGSECLGVLDPDTQLSYTHTVVFDKPVTCCYMEKTMVMSAQKVTNRCTSLRSQKKYFS
jgi:hypothetical protein